MNILKKIYATILKLLVESEMLLISETQCALFLLNYCQHELCHMRPELCITNIFKICETLNLTVS
jgi:hypothetical protein